MAFIQDLSGLRLSLWHLEPSRIVTFWLCEADSISMAVMVREPSMFMRESFYGLAALPRFLPTSELFRPSQTGKSAISSLLTRSVVPASFLSPLKY
jgi:hypothetical protein